MDMKAQVFLQEDRIFYKKLSALVIPIAAQNFMTAMVGASDALMLGMQGQTALSAVSLATQVQFVLTLFFSALTIGATVLAAQYWGKKDAVSVEHVLAITLRFSVVVSFLFFMAAAFFPEMLMRVFTNEASLITPGVSYLRIVSGSYLCMGVSQVYLCIMKNSERTLKSTIYGSIAVVLNLILNSVFIFGLFGLPEMGIQGAALATLLARIVVLVLVLLENHKKDVVRIRWKYLKAPDAALQKDYCYYTAPVLANNLAWGCGFTMFSVIMGHLGSDAVAANSIANIARNMITCFCLGIGAGSGIIVGNELGRGNLEQAKKYGKKLCKTAAVSGFLSGVLLLACRPCIFLFISNLNLQAQEYLKTMLLICSYYLIGKAINCTVIAGIFCAGGDTRFGLCCDTITMWVVIIPVGLIAAFWLKLPVLWVYFLLNLDEIIKLPAVYRHYKKYQWLKNLTVQAPITGNGNQSIRKELNQS